ncbi:helix-turn-helix domain-containing protein [Streptomyces sp. URMC 125]|uniref:helix-turn-helix domain-containing protein n=1 Tax=Streptomyces sp. URMC 125 TaxID=3423419 RepID=UPI003F1C3FB4
MHAARNERTGARIARARKRRHLTQRQLAELAAVSPSTIAKVEQGIMAASPAVTGAVARALSVPVTDLTGQPYLDELRRDQLDTLIQPIREALDLYDIGSDGDPVPRPLDALHADAERVCARVRAGDLKRVAAELPGLIMEATAAAHDHPSGRAWRVLASTYRTAYDVTGKLGHVDLATVALDRMDWAAQRASDPILAAIRQYMRALVHLRASHYAIGQRLVRSGLAMLDQVPDSRERQVVRGQLHLGAAVLGARAQDGDTADEHLAEAQHLAEETGEAAEVHWLAFGPTNVGVHRVSSMAERDMFPEALDAAATVTLPRSWPASRTSHHLAEVARAQLWTGRTDAAFRSLQEARRVAPQQTKYHPLVRETYMALESAQRRLPTTFANYGAWLGM